MGEDRSRTYLSVGSGIGPVEQGNALEIIQNICFRA